MLFGTQTSDLALPGTRYRVGPLSENPSLVLWSKELCYRCRVDFKQAPTRNVKFRLDLIELPSKPQILVENGTRVQEQGDNSIGLRIHPKIRPKLLFKRIPV